MARKITDEQRQRNRLRSKNWAIKNRDRVKANFARWYALNREKMLATAKAWSLANPERFAANQAAYRKAFSKERCFQVVKRRAECALATPKWANQFFMEEAYDLARRRTALKTGGHAKWHVDHIVPLKSRVVCGLNSHTNLRVVPSVTNLIKGNRHWPDMP